MDVCKSKFDIHEKQRNATIEVFGIELVNRIKDRLCFVDSTQITNNINVN